MHKYPNIYAQCESKYGYDYLMLGLKHNTLLKILDENCLHDEVTYCPVMLYYYTELLDFLDGNGFTVSRHGNNYEIAPIVKLEDPLF